MRKKMYMLKGRYYATTTLPTKYLQFFFDNATERLKKIIEQVPDKVVPRDNEDNNKSLASVAKNSDDDDSHI